MAEEEKDIYSLEGKDDVIEVLKTVSIKKMKLRRSIYTLSREKSELLSINRTIEEDVMRKIRTETIIVSEEVKVNKQGMTLEAKKALIPEFKDVPKEKYSSEPARELEQRVRLMNRQDYEANRKKTDNLDQTIKSNEITLKYLGDILRSAEALVHAGK